jgi:hypothetical protein
MQDLEQVIFTISISFDDKSSCNRYPSDQMTANKCLETHSPYLTIVLLNLLIKWAYLDIAGK